MKLFFLLLTILPLAVSTLPAGRHQQPIGLSPANSFSSSTSSDLESNSDSSTISKSSRLKSFFSRPNSPIPSGEFKCHHYPRTSIPSLIAISDYITTLLRSYRETLFEGSDPYSNSNIFETCYAGYDADDTSPSIYFGKLGKKRAGKVEKILRNRVMGRWQGVSIVTGGDNVVAVVVQEKQGEVWRNTV